MKQRTHAEDNGPAFIPVKSKHRWPDKDQRPEEIIKVQAGSHVGVGHVAVSQAKLTGVDKPRGARQLMVTE